MRRGEEREIMGEGLKNDEKENGSEIQQRAIMSHIKQWSIACCCLYANS